jgi:DNA-binding NarL/FixJ family response regulator
MTPAPALPARAARRAPPSVRRVVLIDDHAAILEMMQSAVEALPGFQVVGRAETAAAARELCRRERPDIVILDLRLAEASGLALLPELQAAWGRSKVIIFSGHLRLGAIRAALLAGAHGLVEKTAPLEEFHRALRLVGAGQVYFSRYTSDEIRRLVQRRPGQPPRLVRLTEREKSVLRGIAEGLSSKEVAARLGVSRHAIVHHRTRLTKKTGLRGVAQFARYAVQAGLIGDTVAGAAEAI